MKNKKILKDILFILLCARLFVTLQPRTAHGAVGVACHIAGRVLQRHSVLRERTFLERYPWLSNFAHLTDSTGMTATKKFC